MDYCQIKKWENITRLLDDDNQVVRDSLLKEFNQNPKKSLIFLKEIVAGQMIYWLSMHKILLNNLDG